MRISYSINVQDFSSSFEVVPIVVQLREGTLITSFLSMSWALFQIVSRPILVL
jgi:hypothetical protein